MEVNLAVQTPASNAGDLCCKESTACSSTSMGGVGEGGAGGGGGGDRVVEVGGEPRGSKEGGEGVPSIPTLRMGGGWAVGRPDRQYRGD